MWSHLGARNLVSLQQMAALAEIDRRIKQDWENGYGPDVDALLERRHDLKRCLEDQTRRDR